MKLKLRILITGFIVSFLLVAGFSAISFLQMRRLELRDFQVEHTYRVLSRIAGLRYQTLLIDKTTFRFATIHDSALYHDFTDAAAVLIDSTERLKQATYDNTDQQNNVVVLQSDEALYINDCRHLFSDSAVAPAAFLQSKAYEQNRVFRTAVTAKLDSMKSVELRLLDKRQLDRQDYLQLTTSTVRILSIVFSLFTLVAFGLLLREFKKRLHYQNELQQKISEIAQSKRELEHIAYATSHDLQEPLRKIRILTDKWYSENRELVDDKSRKTLERVTGAAARMQDLVGELMMLASLNADAKKVPCTIRTFIEAAIQSLEKPIAARHAKVEVGSMPMIQGYPDQVKMLFRNLIDNAIKFSAPDRPPEIMISSRRAGGEELLPQFHTAREFYCITVADNGIGFDNRYVEKMFGIFRQLHNEHDGYHGKGTGLAICQRIMTNHKGYILAHGFPGEGATFKLYFPIENADSA